MTPNRKQRRAMTKAKERDAAAQAKRVVAADDADGLRQKGDALSRIGNFAEAAKHYRRAIELAPGNIAIHGSLGFVLVRSGKFDEAAEAYRGALAIEPDNYALMHDLGTLLVRMRRYEEGETYLRQVVQLRPGLPQVHFNLGQLYSALARTADAKQEFQQAFSAYKAIQQREPQNVDVLFNMGRSLMRMGNHLDAADWFRAALAIDSHHVLANYNLGRALETQGKLEDAERHLQIAVAGNPKLANGHYALGNVYMRIERHDRAAFHLRHVVRLDPENAESRHFLGAMRPGRAPDKAPEKYVADLFDGYADRFDDHLVNHLQYRAPNLLRAAVSPFAGAADGRGLVLDLGCGTGLCGPLFKDLTDRMIGVDLSPQMLKKAEARGLYDELLCEDITAVMERFTGDVAGAVAGDVLVYIGKLEPVFAAARRALQNGGWFAFTTEVSHEGDFVLNVTGRYGHSEAYIRRTAAENGLTVSSLEPATGRMQGGEPVQVHVVVLQNLSS